MSLNCWLGPSFCLFYVRYKSASNRCEKIEVCSCDSYLSSLPAVYAVSHPFWRWVVTHQHFSAFLTPRYTFPARSWDQTPELPTSQPWAIFSGPWFHTQYSHLLFSAIIEVTWFSSCILLARWSPSNNFWVLSYSWDKSTWSRHYSWYLLWYFLG